MQSTTSPDWNRYCVWKCWCGKTCFISISRDSSPMPPRSLGPLSKSWTSFIERPISCIPPNSLVNAPITFPALSSRSPIALLVKSMLFCMLSRVDSVPALISFIHSIITFKVSSSFGLDCWDLNTKITATKPMINAPRIMYTWFSMAWLYQESMI